jgi:hypothetical protein
VLAGVSRFFIIAPPWFRAGGELLLSHGARLAIWGLVLVIAVPVVERALDNQAVLDLLTGTGANVELSVALANLRDNLTMAPGLVLLLIGLGSMAAVWAYSPLALSPLSLSQDSQRLDGAVFAQDIPVRLRDELERGAWDDERASTYWERDDATGEASVLDTGTVRLKTLIESPVSLEENAVPSYWLVPAIAGASITMLAFAIYYGALPAASDFVPRDRADVLNGPLLPTALWTLAVLLIAGVGPLLVQTTRLMAGVYHYRSTVVYVEIDGSFTRSEVNVGKARTDSIESRNLVVRSNLVLRYFVAEVASESLGLNATRRLIALDSTASTDAVLPMLQAVLQDQLDAGVAPVSIDLGAAGTRRGVASNLATLQASASALAPPPVDLPAIAPVVADDGAGPISPPQPPPTSGQEPASRGALGRLSELQAIFDASHLTTEEFEQKKAEIIYEL